MKGADLKAFRKANNLTQDKLGLYLGIKKSFISQVESDKCPLPQEKFIKLLENPNGWDISMLTTPRQSEAGLNSLAANLREMKHEVSHAQLRSTIENIMTPDEKFIIAFLERKLEEKDALINELYKQLGKYEALLKDERKGEAAPSAGDSLSASAI